MNRSKAGADERAKSHSADFLQLDLTEAPAGALSDWLAAELRRAIGDGRLPIGSRLPASRLLAAELQVSRGVVTEAYQRLNENGQVIGRRRGGTIVAAVSTPIPESRPGPMTAPKAADLFTGPAGSGTFDLLRSARATIDLFPGLPDLTAFPRSAWLRAERAVLAESSATDLAYGDPRGSPAFRVAVAR